MAAKDDKAPAQAGADIPDPVAPAPDGDKSESDLVAETGGTMDAPVAEIPVAEPDPVTTGEAIPPAVEGPKVLVVRHRKLTFVSAASKATV